MDQFKALWIDKLADEKPTATFKEISLDDLSEGDVVVKLSHSTVNYKDGLCLAGNPGVLRKTPMVPGIDVIGEVVSSQSPDFKNGDQVIMNGFGVGEVHTGAFAQYARLKSKWLIKRPEGLSAAHAAAIGTAGYTAMLCVMALEDYGITPDKGPIAITGASGGVGSVALSILSKLGYETIAFTGRMQEETFLKQLGASEVRDRASLSEKGRPFAKEQWAGAVDVAGSHTLANLLAATKYGGAVAACGLAQGADLQTTVMPFILRGVALLGVDSVQASLQKRQKAYDRLLTDLDMNRLEALSTTIKLEDVPEYAKAILEGKVRGRLIVDIEG
ncbi:MDR family oxidoreductase [Polycladidibacter stylochi]|uniref:acrylyl-CoA reductase (NADPH) n=1 Tax=Polycladidibacter stylochi TaxID=1807766 RepID=UPI000832FD97|nr:MDR family oxidoreductase [Pseudovibrio stylochi]